MTPEQLIEEAQKELEALKMKRSTIHEHPDFAGITFPNVSKEAIFFGRKEPREYVQGYRAIVDWNKEPQNAVFKIASEGYKLVYHEEVAYAVMEAANELTEFGKPSFKCYLPHSGAKMRLEASFPDVTHSIKASKKGDIVSPGVLVYNSYDLSWKLRHRFQVRILACENGATVGETWSNYSQRHIEALEVSALVESIKEGMQLFSEHTSLWNKWAQTRIDAATYDKLWDDLPFSPKEREKIEELEDVGTQLLLPDALSRDELTLWDFHNVVSQYTTHEITNDVKRTDIEPIITRVFETQLS